MIAYVVWHASFRRLQLPCQLGKCAELLVEGFVPLVGIVLAVRNLFMAVVEVAEGKNHANFSPLFGTLLATDCNNRARSGWHRYCIN